VLDHISSFLSIGSSLTSSRSLESLSDWRHCSGSTAFTTFEKFETSFYVFFYFTTVSLTNFTSNINLNILLNNFDEMFLLVTTIEDKHVIRANGTIATKLELEEAKHMFRNTVHGLSLFSKVDPGRFGCCSRTLWLDQLEASGQVFLVQNHVCNLH